MPKQNRLRKKNDFEKVLKEGRWVKNDFLFLKWTFNNLKVSRFGFVVSRKTSKKSTLRNKIKRRLREIIKRELPKIKKGIDGVFISKSGLEKEEFQQLKETVSKILTKARILKK
ncbi:ribonuclease P protein component [Patescibacteria group bacterium]|nr:ribonuclease P protein component [Patescibacteria group bacterium]